MRKFLILSLALILIMIGCMKNTTTIFVTGTINPWDHIDIQLLSTPMVSDVSGTVNGNPLTVNFNGWNVDLTSDMDISSGSSYTINITTDRGTGNASVIVPGTFDIAYPPNDTVLSPNSDVILQWTASVNANWYKVYIHHTSTNISDTTYILGDTNSLTVPGRMFTQTNDRITIAIYAENGPTQLAGEKGNITGDIKGYINAEYNATVHFWIR